MSNTTLYIIGAVIIAFIAYRFFFSASANVDPQQVEQDVKDKSAQVIDVRTKSEYKAGHLALSSLNWDVTNGEFEKKIGKLDKDKTYYLYCRSGNRSGQAARIMKSNGFENVVNIGGYQSLVRKGFESAN